MLVTFIGDNKMYRLSLADGGEGDYWIKDVSGKDELKLVNIKSKNGKWFIKSSKYSKIVNDKYIRVSEDNITAIAANNNIMSEAELKEYSKYYISPQNSESIYVLFCTSSYEKNVMSYRVNTKEEITIGKNSKNDIIINDDLVNDYHASIFKKNGRWFVENYDLKTKIFKNMDVVDEDSEELENGDIIFIAGIKIMILGDLIHIFGKNDKVKVQGRTLQSEQIVNQRPKIIDEPVDDDENIELYSEDDYFYNSPRIKDKIDDVNVTIDQPPSPSGSGSSGILQFLSTFTTMAMGSVTLLTLVNTVSNMNRTNQSALQKSTRIVSSCVMLVSMLLIPIIRMIIQKKINKRKEKVRQIEYKRYINSKIVTINRIMESRSAIMKEENMSAEQCERVVLEKSNELWERQKSDEDFLNINIGTGDMPLDIGLKAQEKKFTLEHDSLLDIYYDVANQSRTLEEIPITLPLTRNRITAFIIDTNKMIKDYMENIVLQLITLQNYRDLKLVFLVKDESLWDYAKSLPHVWDDSKQIRFFGSNHKEIKEISQYLEEVIGERSADDNDGMISISRRQKDYRMFDSYYLIITDDYRNLKNVRILNRVLGTGDDLGFGLLCVTKDITQLPNECKTFVEINEDGKCLMFRNEVSSSTKIDFHLDNSEKYDYNKISRVISNIPMKYTSTKATSLPDHYNFLEMYNAGNIDQLNVLDRWRLNDSTQSLQAQIGIDATGAPVYLDAHEKYHGPHGLIAGTTGSGKSEFIITYILSLAINYHPDDVTFVLVDYKGGGLAGAFKKKNIQLPHLVGTITNIDSVGLQRSLESIQSELRRRQVMFNEAKNETNESTIDIYKYQKLYHDGVLKHPISHLFIICDEFAELKQQQPDFMSELMSVSRIGRSLGVHLILATQKPAGIVNDQIRSNSKFGVCLKVQDKSDSKDIIKKTDAAMLKRAGQFYINVGNDEYFALGQSGYTGVPYEPSESVKVEQNNYIDFISNTGASIKRIEDKVEIKKTTNAKGDQLTNIVNYLGQLAKKRHIEERQLWLDPIPENISIKGIRDKYSVEPVKNIINPIIGEYDDPFNQLQNVLTLNLTKDGNTAIYGSADSGKELVLSSVIYDTAVTHTPDEVNFYILDFGSETMRIFSKFPHVGDVVFSDDVEKINRLLKMIKQEIKDRKQKLAEYNGDYELYLSKSNEKMPLMVIIINEYGTFSQAYQSIDEELTKITKECMKYGIVFIFTASTVNELRTRITQNCKRKIALQIIGDDYSYIFNKARRKKPSSLSGRGLTTVDSDDVYEFQTTKICKPENLNDYIKSVSEKLNKRYPEGAQSIPVLPKVVNIESVSKAIFSAKEMPVGISAKNIKPYAYNFKGNIVNIVASKQMENIRTFIMCLKDVMIMTHTIEPIIIDMDNFDSNNIGPFIETFNGMTNKLGENMYNKSDKDIIYIILGIGKFIDMMGAEKNRFDQNIEIAKVSQNVSFIVADTAATLKSHAMDSWFKSNVTPGCGMYIGNGFDSQFLISYEADRRSLVPNCGDSMGYVVNKGKPEYIKFLGIEEKSDDDE